ncbi:MAG: helicase, partial [Polyangiaceae bacterium]|nr:helicase [Polyangiaceae bacterium]
GTFGTLSPLPSLPERLVARLEEHRFPVVTRLVWRNTDLDLSSIDALVASLAAPSPHPLFTRVEQADDFDLLRIFAERPSIRARARGEEAVRLLWDVCQVPDYRKLLLLDHATLLEALFVMLVDRGRLDLGWVEQQVDRIDRVEGEIDELTARLAAVRVWTYISHQRAWLEGSLEERTREVEDRLGDALHERLVERFVERAPRTISIPRAQAPGAKGQFFAQIGGMLEDLRRAEERERERWVERIIAAPHDAFAVDDEGVIRLGSEAIGRLVGGRDILSPGATVSVDAAIGAGARVRIERRLTAFARDFVSELLSEVTSHEAEGLVRGVLWQLERGLGTLDVDRARTELAALGDEERRALESRGVVIGARTVFAPALLAPEPLRQRALLVQLHRGADSPASPPPGAVTMRRDRELPFESYLALGFVPLGPRAVRVDIVERVLARLRELESPFEMPKEIGGILGVKRREMPRVMGALGYQLRGDRWEAKKRR